MKIFNSLEEMKPYYNENTNTYKFVENNKLIDIDIRFNLYVQSDIESSDIKACDIKAYDINACNINACDITACNINSWDIKARNINALDIIFYAVCVAYKTFVCNSIKGKRKNSKFFCLDSDVVIRSADY